MHVGEPDERDDLRVPAVGVAGQRERPAVVPDRLAGVALAQFDAAEGVQRVHLVAAEPGVA